MTELATIFITSALTLIGGVFLLVLGEVIKGFFIEPIHELAQLRGKITNTLILNAHIINNPGVGSPDSLLDAHRALRRRASQLLARSNAIPWYGLWRRLGFVPKRDDVDTASMLLIGLSNRVFKPEDAQQNTEDWKKLMRLMGHRDTKTRKAPPSPSDVVPQQ